MNLLFPSLLRVLVTLLFSVTTITIFTIQNPPLGRYQSSDPPEIVIDHDNRAVGEETYSAFLIDTPSPAEPHQYLDGYEINRLISPNKWRIARSVDMRCGTKVERNHRLRLKPKHAAVIKRGSPGIPVVLRKLII